MFLQCLKTWSFLLFSLRRMSLLKTDGKLVIVVAKCGDGENRNFKKGLI